MGENRQKMGDAPKGGMRKIATEGKKADLAKILKKTCK